MVATTESMHDQAMVATTESMHDQAGCLSAFIRDWHRDKPFSFTELSFHFELPEDLFYDNHNSLRWYHPTWLSFWTPPSHVQIWLWPLTLLISFIITRTSAKIDNGWINLQRLRKPDHCRSPMNTDDSSYRYKTTRTSEPAVRRKHEGTFDRQKVWPRWRRPFMYGYGKVTKYFSLLNVGMTEDSVLGILAGSSFSVPTHLPITVQC